MCDDAFSLPPTPSSIPLQISLRAREAEAASPSSPSTHEPAIDLSHHLSKLAKNRMQSPLKGLYRYFNREGILMLAGGLPPPDYFPYDSLTATTLASNSFRTTEQGLGAWLWSFVAGGKKTTSWSIEKYETEPTKVQLSSALQYGTAAGLPALHGFINTFTARVYKPGYSDWATVVNAGSTDAWGKIVTTLLESGDGILAEEWTYPSALATAWPSGMKPVALSMDGEGIIPEAMDALLGNWNPDEHGGMRRPSLLYTVPVLQNPTGASMPVERKKQIYALAVKYDVIIVEDDPYYFLQTGPYGGPPQKEKESDDEFIAKLIPSYLELDTEGRVVRIDTFSKTICPGSRLGWTTCNSLFAERLERANESSTQAASGFSQALVGKLLAEEWGMDGYMRWLKGIKSQYRTRRDTLVSNLLNEGGAHLESRQATSLSAGGPVRIEMWTKERRDEKGFSSEKHGGGGKKVLSFIAPEGGMFIWLKIHLSAHPSYPHKPASELLESLWEAVAEANLLVAPGGMFSVKNFGKDVPSPSDSLTDDNEGFFRLSFSSATPEQMKKAAQILKKTTAEFFRA